jgi:hypothetical protein
VAANFPWVMLCFFGAWWWLFRYCRPRGGVFLVLVFWLLLRVVGRLIFDSLVVFKYVEICGIHCLWLTSTASVATDFSRVMSVFVSQSCLLDSGGPIIFASRSGVSV